MKQEINSDAKFSESQCDQLLASTDPDGSARIQTVRKITYAKYHALIHEWDNRTRVPVVLNTSFNIEGEPVVESPRDAVRCFYSKGLYALLKNSFVITKEGTA